MEADAIERQVLDLLGAVSTMTLATCSGNLPWATDVYFAPVKYDLVFFSSPNSRHSSNLEINPSGAATIHPTVTDWNEITGLQVEGSVHPLDDVDSEIALEAYLKKFPFAAALFANPTLTADRLKSPRLYVLRSRRVNFLSNRIRFGAKFGCDVSGGLRVSDYH